MSLQGKRMPLMELLSLYPSPINPLCCLVLLLQGLEDQLLSDVVRKERPDLESAKDQLVVSISNDKKQLQELEDKVGLGAGYESTSVLAMQVACGQVSQQGENGPCKFAEHLHALAKDSGAHAL